MSKRILIGCYEIPGFGGASTSSYQLFENLQNDGFDVSYVNIIHPGDEEYFKILFGENFGNPGNLGNVFNCVLNGESSGSQSELEKFIQECSPHIMMGMGYIAALHMKRAAPAIPIIFFSVGCRQVNEYVPRKGDFLSFQNHVLETKAPLAISNNSEKKAVQLSNLIIAHSDSMKFLFQTFYPSHVKKLYDEVIWKAEAIWQRASKFSFLSRPFSGRDIDLLFLASSWKRPVKNFPLVKKIVSYLKDLKIHIVGDSQPYVPQVIQHPLITKQEDVFNLLGRAKTVICPSLFDAAPGILFEASALGCNMIASKNCGNWKICHPTLLAEPFTEKTVLEKIRLSLEKKFHDNMDYFLQTQSYANLKGILQVFA